MTAWQHITTWSPSIWFCTLWHCDLECVMCSCSVFTAFSQTFWPNINWWARHRAGLCLCQVWRFWFQPFGFIVRTNRQTDRITHRRGRSLYSRNYRRHSEDSWLRHVLMQHFHSNVTLISTTSALTWVHISAEEYVLVCTVKLLHDTDSRLISKVVGILVLTYIHLLLYFFMQINCYCYCYCNT